MAKIAFILLFVLANLDSLYAGDGMAEAVAAQRTGDHTRALGIYLKLEASGPGSKGMYANMATAYAHNRQDALAILYLEKALKFNPSDTKLLAALQAIRKKNPDLPERESGPAVLKWWNTITGALMPDTWTWIFLILTAATGILAVANFPWRKGKKIAAPLAVIVMLLVFVLAAAIQTHHKVFHSRDLIITDEYSVLRKGPDPESPEISTLPAGMKVTQSDALSTWLQVTSEYGDTGWIEASKTRKI